MPAEAVSNKNDRTETRGDFATLGGAVFSDWFAEPEKSIEEIRDVICLVRGRFIDDIRDWSRALYKHV